MNKLAEKISSVMNEKELDDLITDHYRGEAQLLTQGTEANLLKLAELRGKLDEEGKARWEKICKDFQRIKSMGGEDADSGQRIANQIAELVGAVNDQTNAVPEDKSGERIADQLAQLVGAVSAAKQKSTIKLPVPKPNSNSNSVQNIASQVALLINAINKQSNPISITNAPSKAFDDVLEILNGTITHTLIPLVRRMDNRIAQDAESHQMIEKLRSDVSKLKGRDKK